MQYLNAIQTPRISVSGARSVHRQWDAYPDKAIAISSAITATQNSLGTVEHPGTVNQTIYLRLHLSFNSPPAFLGHSSQGIRNESINVLPEAESLLVIQNDLGYKCYLLAGHETVEQLTWRA